MLTQHRNITVLAPGTHLENGLQAPTRTNPNHCRPDKKYYFGLHMCAQLHEKCHTLQHLNKKRANRQGIYSIIEVESAGFYYTDHDDIARCDKCGLQVSEWTSEIKPFTMHSQRSPTCEFVRSMLPNHTILSPLPINLLISGEQQPIKRQRTQTTLEASHVNHLVEVDMLKQVRKRTFSNWPHQTSPSSTQMIQAGFFGCNVGDRVICLYCNIICQQWKPHIDDPCEMHKILSPKCPYVTGMSSGPKNISLPSVKVYSWNTASNKTALNQNYVAPKRRYASFIEWPIENLPSVDALVRAGFFFAGTKTIVTCFYCNGSLQNWEPNDNPMIEHARRFPHCAYARQMCDVDLYRKIQECNNPPKETDNSNETTNQIETEDDVLNRTPQQTSGGDGMPSTIGARLGLPICQRLLKEKFKLPIIKRVLDDQFRSKNDDFDDDCDLLVACMISEKQLKCTNEQGRNVVIPTEYMQKQREQ